jgi:hypothetical protein
MKTDISKLLNQIRNSLINRTDYLDIYTKNNQTFTNITLIYSEWLNSTYKSVKNILDSIRNDFISTDLANLMRLKALAKQINDLFVYPDRLESTLS